MRLIGSNTPQLLNLSRARASNLCSRVLGQRYAGSSSRAATGRRGAHRGRSLASVSIRTADACLAPPPSPLLMLRRLRRWRWRCSCPRACGWGDGAAARAAAPDAVPPRGGGGVAHATPGRGGEGGGGEPRRGGDGESGPSRGARAEVGRAEAGRAVAGQAEVGRAEPWRGRGETVVGGDVAICGGTGRDVAERDLARRGACGVCVCVCVCVCPRSHFLGYRCVV